MSGLFGSGPKVEQPQATAAITVQQSSYGTPVALLYGTNRLYGNLIWYGGFYAQPVSNSGGGGKGGAVGGGGKGGGSSYYQYWVSFAIGLCEGELVKTGEVYVSKQISDVATLGGQLFEGTQGQTPWGFLTTGFPDQALSYSELAYVAFPNFSLGTSTETPQFSFEGTSSTTFGESPDCRGDQFFIDFLARAGMDLDNIGTFASCATYWQAIGFLISPLIDQQNAARDWCKQVMDTLNAEFVWYPSQGYVDAVPYGDMPVTANGATYTPNLTPIYSLDDDDYIRDSDDADPVTCTRTDMSDVYNQVPIEYINRADQYNIETYTAFDDSLVDEFGFRTSSTLTAHHFTDPNVAQQSATLYLNRQIYVRNTYQFKLPWNYILLDPMDIIAITDSNLGLDNQLVRIIDIQIEDEGNDGDGLLTFNVEEVPNAIAGAALIPSFGTDRSTPNYNIDPGSVNPPTFFEAPLAFLQAAQVEVDIGISGENPNWGGCDIFVSTDNTTFKLLAQFNSKSRMGVLTSPLPSFAPSAGGNNIDTVNILSIDMTESSGTLNNAANDQDATLLNTLCVVEGELMAYGNDALTAVNEYELSYLNRGAYGSAISAHPTTANFVIFDDNVFKYDIDQTRVGQTLYFKFLSFNSWGSGQQTLDEVAEYTYKVLGTALLTPLPNPTNLSVSYNQFIGQLNWTGVSDIRYPIQYEIRKGASFSSAQIVGITAQTNYDVYGQDTFWITALYFTPLGVAVYSSSPVSIAVSTPSVPLNLIESYDEASTHWSGTCSGGAVVNGVNEIQLAGSGDILAVADVIDLPDIIYYGGVASSGTYTAPLSHQINSNHIINAKVMCNWALAGLNTAAGDVIANPDVLATQDVLDGASQAQVYAIPQIRLSQDSGSTWSAWQNWVPGFYTFNAIQFSIKIFTLSSQVTAILSDFNYIVDVPQLTQTGSLTTSASGTTPVAFPNKFNDIPIVSPTIVNAQAGDIVQMTAPTESGFSLGVVNSGSNVVRTVTWSATAF